MVTKPVKWLFVNLIYCYLIKGEDYIFRDYKTYSKLIANLSVGLVDRYGAKCGTILYSNSENNTWFEDRQVYILLKVLGKDNRFEPPILATTFKNFLGFNTQKTNQPRCVRRIFIILGWFKNASQDFAELSHKFEMKGSIWVVFLDRDQKPHKFLEKVVTPFNTDMILARIISTTTVNLEEVYRVETNYPLRITKYGTYTDGKITFPKFLSLYSRRHDLEGFPVRISTRDDFPICGYIWDKNGQKKIGGYFGLIMYELAQLLNFTPVHIDAKENLTGRFINGKWDGLVGMLERNEIDFAAGPMAVDRRALSVSDYVRPLLRTNYQVFFKQAGDIVIWNAILRPFGSLVWCVILGSIFFGAICLHIFYMIGVHCEKELELYKEDFSKINTFFLFLKAFCFQSSSAVPNSWPCRLLFITGYLTSTVLVTAYSASLISYLTTSQPIRPFDSLETLLGDGTYSLTAILGTTDYGHFANASNPLYQNIYQKLMKNIPTEDLPKGKEEGMEQVCYKEKWALFVSYLVAQITAREYSEERDCKILHFTNHLDKVFLTIGRRKNFPFADLVEFYVQIMESSGILRRLQNYAWPLERGETLRSYKQVTIEKVIQIHVVLITGIVISLIIYIIEVIYYNHRNRKKKDPDLDVNEFHERLFFSNNLKYLNSEKHDLNKEDDLVKYRGKRLIVT